MIEAFEIGVSLALQDGVSDAITKAQRDVATLEQAVRESGVSVQSLREAGKKVSSVSFSDRPAGVAEEPVKRAVQEAAPGVATEAPPVPFVALLGARQAEQPSARAQEAFAPRAEPAERGSALSVAQPSVAAPEAFVPAVGRAADSVAHFAGPPADSAPEGPVAGPVVVVPVARGLADRPDGSPEANPDAVAPVVVTAPETGAPRRAALGDEGQPAVVHAPLLRQQSAAADAAPAVALAASPDRDAQAEAGGLSLQSALRFSGGPVAAPQDAEERVAPAGEAADSGDDSGTDDVQSAPSFAATPYGVAAPGGAAGSGARTEKAPRQAEQGASGPNEGDVFLDGMLVGRWMSRFLNREAERASAGPTGFDARRGRLLPGVTVGG